MKRKLIFIDNDFEESTVEDIDHAKDCLDYYGKLDNEYIETMESISSFHKMEKDKAAEILFNPDNIICTWSMYTGTHYGSLYQLTGFLTMAGRNQVKNIIYIDTSGNANEALDRAISNTKEPLHILNAVETNFIISPDTDSDEFDMYRLRLELKGSYEPMFKKEKINLQELLIK